MKVVLDTSVLVSGLVFGGPPSAILKAWTSGRVQVAISPDIHDEYEGVVARFEEAFPDLRLSELLAVLAIGAEWCRPDVLDERVSADPADDKFLACAISSGATVVVSGDKHLLRVSGYRNIEVLTPRAFVDRYLADRGVR